MSAKAIQGKETILEEAGKLIYGDRRQAYGPVRESFERIASVWSAVLKHPVTPSQVGLMMVGLKLCRESNRPGRDNRVDLAAYAALVDILENDLETPA